MRILFISHYALPHLGGVEIVVDQLARELLRHGCTVTHVAAASLRPGESLTEEPPYRVIRLPALNPLESTLAVPYPLFEPVQLWRTIARESRTADVVHAHGMLYAGSLLGLEYAKRRRRDAVRVLTEHAGRVGYRSSLLNGAEKVAIGTIGRKTAGAAETIVVVGQRIQQEMRTLSPATPVECIENGVDLSLFRPATDRERAHIRGELGWDERPRVLFVGRMVEKKGARVVLETARLSNRFRFVIVGPRGDQVPAGLADSFDGSTLPRTSLADIYRAADAFLLPSHGEGGFPLTAREAMACGLPVILGEDPAYGEIAARAAEGIRLVPARTPEIVEAIDDLLAAGAVAREAVARFAASSFLWSHAAERHLELYERLRAGRGRTGDHG